MLCESYDIVLLQEHWLLPFEMDTLSNFHGDFLATGSSAVDISQNIFVGRPYGGTGILYRRKIAKAISVLNTDEPRLTAVRLMTNDGPILIVNVYMPTEYGTADCYDNYSDVCAKIGAMFNDTDAAYLLVTSTATVVDHHGFLTSFPSSQSITHYCVPTETVWGTCLHIVKMMSLAPHGSTTFCVANFWMTELLILVFGMTFSAQIIDLCQWPSPIWRLIYVLYSPAHALFTKHCSVWLV